MWRIVLILSIAFTGCTGAVRASIIRVVRLPPPGASKTSVVAQFPTAIPAANPEGPDQNDLMCEVSIPVESLKVAGLEFLLDRERLVSSRISFQTLSGAPARHDEIVATLIARLGAPVVSDRCIVKFNVAEGQLTVFDTRVELEAASASDLEPALLHCK